MEVDLFTKEICNIDKDSGILMVGSAVQKDSDMLKDLDLILLSNKHHIKEILKEMDGYKQQIDGSLRFTSEKIEIGISPCTILELKNRVNNVLLGAIDPIYKSWAIGAECPEGLLGDIANGKIISDTPEEDLKCLKELVIPYPESLRTYIISYCKKDLSMRITQLEQAIKRADLNSILILKGQILFLIIRLTYSQQRKYFQGSKSLVYNKDIEILLQTSLDLIKNTKLDELDKLCEYLKSKFI